MDLLSELKNRIKKMQCIMILTKIQKTNYAELKDSKFFLNSKNLFKQSIVFLCCLFSFSLSYSQAINFEAEDAVLFNSAAIRDCASCSGGKFVGDMGGPSNGYFTSTANVNETGTYKLTFSFSSGDPRSIFISVNEGSATRIVCDSGEWGVFDTKEIFIDLSEGDNSIRFFNETDYAPDIDNFVIELQQTPPPSSLSFEAENGVLFNGANIQDCGSCSNGKQVGNLGGSSNGYFAQLVTVNQEGIYTMDLSFSSGDPRSIFISVDDGGAIEVVCDSGDWGVVGNVEVDISLKSGNNTIKFFNENGFGPNIDKFDLRLKTSQFNCTNCEKITFSNNGEIYYNLDTGTTTIIVNGLQIVGEAYANLTDGSKTFTSKEYTTRAATKTSISDGFGLGEKTTINLSGNNLPNIQQVFYTYPDKRYFFTEVILQGANVQSNYIAPLISNNVNIYSTGDNRTLTVPFDNDTFIRYNSNIAVNNANSTSSEVTAFYDNTSRNGIVVGSVDQSVWKTGVRTIASGSSLSELNVWAGYTSSNLTRDGINHGTVIGDNIKSPKIFVGFFDDWRIGMEEFGKANAISQPSYIFDWTEPTPFGWNSWGVIQDNINLQNAKAVANFMATELPEFRSGDTAFIDLDSFWDNLVEGGLEGDFSKLTEFVNYCKERGLTPGIYWAPFIDFGKFDRKVEGSSFNYINAWTKVNGGYHDFDDGRAMDPTHPATKDRINLVIDKFKKSGFEMIKIDFIGHAAVESDGFFDSTVKTGMQAFHHGMKYLIDRLDGQMLVYTAISPSLATAPYSHMRRIATDAFTDINETQYTLNSTTYGWWQTYMYDFIDADHIVFRDASIGENRARLISGVVTGTLTIGDDYSTQGPWVENSKLLLQNKEILTLAADGKAFRPVEGNSREGASETFIKQDGDVYYLAIINYGDEKTYNLNLNRLGIANGTHCVKEYFSGKQFSTGTEALQFTIAGKNAQIFEITTGNSNCAFSLATNNFNVQSRNVSCPGQDNGRLFIDVVDQNYEYNVSINGVNSFVLPNADSEFKYISEDLLPGDYEVCFKVNGINNYEQCFQVTISEPEVIDVSTKYNKSSGNKKVAITMNGSDEYKVYINGEKNIIMTSGEHEFELNIGENEVIVKGKKECQGIYSEKIFVSPGIQVYPNPIIDFLQIYIPENSKEGALQVFSAQGALLLQSTKKAFSSNVTLNLQSLKSGIYFLRISDEKFQETIKIIKQ